VNVHGCEAVRRRKEVLERKIDEVASDRSDAEILAVACGHLREAEGSLALKQGGVARLLATDQDQISLAKADRYRHTISSCIEVRNLTVRNLITAKHELGRFDLVYAAGLYDYLDARVAARLTTTLFTLLKSGGRLLIPNFLTGLNQQAYMEVYMDWYLLYRTRSDIEAFADGIPSAERGRTDYFEDDTGTIGYLEIEHA
jgi:chemotaxis methyl-accepting protein methylase